MGSYPFVSRGDKFVPSAQRENEITRLLNTLNGFSGGAFSAPGSGYRVKVYNAGSERLEAGSAVSFVKGDISGDSVPVSVYDGNSTWGVLTDDIAPQEFGSVVISGPVQVTMASEGDGVCAVPSADGKTFEFSGDGATVLCSSKVENEVKAVVVLGFGSGGVSLCKIVSVPSAGYGKGTAKMITGYNADGTPVLAEEETPVFIPRI